MKQAQEYGNFFFFFFLRLHSRTLLYASFTRTCACFTRVDRQEVRPGLGGRGGGIQDIRKCMGICNDRDKS